MIADRIHIHGKHFWNNCHKTVSQEEIPICEITLNISISQGIEDIKF